MKLLAGQLALTLLLFVMAILVIGTAIFPGAWLAYATWTGLASALVPLRLLAVCLASVAGYLVFGLALILLVALLRTVLRLDLREGEFRIGSPGMVRWMLANALQFVVSMTFMEFILLTPLAPWFFRLMGARVGRNVQINSSFCADLSLLEIGDGAVIGGHATVIAHSFEQHGLILRRVTIGRQAVIGLNAVVLPGASIGERATVAAGAVVPKGAQVAPGSVYRGAAAEAAQRRDA
jgi:hypothetical protein